MLPTSSVRVCGIYSEQTLRKRQIVNLAAPLILNATEIENMQVSAL